MSARASLLVVAFTALAAQPVAADSEWYGWQTLIADGGGMLAIVGTNTVHHVIGENAATVTLFAGLADLVIGAPIVHLVHGEELHAFYSVSARALLPLAGGAIGGNLFPCKPKEPWDCFLFGDGTFYGGVIGLGTAIALDAIVLAREDVAPSDTQLRMFVLRGAF